MSSTDPHQSEAVATHWKTVQWLTGFTGSMGYAIVTEDDAQFWTDGRYTTQAKREIAPDTFRINTIAMPGVSTWDAWLKAQLQPGDVVAVTGEVMSEAQRRDFKAKLGLSDDEIRHDRDLVGEIWTDRPAVPDAPVWELETHFTGLDRSEKLSILRQKLAFLGEKAATLVCGLDEVAWLTNCRGGDNVLYPLFHAYALVTSQTAHLCTNLEKFSPELLTKLCNDGWSLHPYEDISTLVAKLDPSSIVYVDPYKTPFGLYEAMPTGVEIVEGLDWVTAIKAQKNPIEQENIREANRRECAAVVRLMCWIEANVASGELDEYGVGQKLEDFRRLDDHYIQPGNLPIVGYGPNAALPHY